MEARFNSPLEAFLHWETHTPNQIFLKQPINGQNVSWTYAEAGKEARKFATHLKHYNLPKNSHVALLSKNCAHWLMADIAIMMAGFVSIPIYPTLNDKSIHQILEHSESKAIIIGKLDDFESQKNGIPDIHKVSIKMYGENEGDLWESIIDSTEALSEIELPDSEDLHTIIYTSGTTGTPKGVMHTVSNFINSAKVMIDIMNLQPGSRFFSYLPLAHVAERMGIGTHGIVIGGEFSFAETLDTFASDLERCQPNLFLAVPRIWQKFQEKILEKIPQKKLSRLLKIPLLNSIIKNKLKQKLGLRQAQFVFSGAAPLSSNIINWFQEIDITIFQVYGMTEDCIISHFNKPGANKVGTVGRAFDHVSIKLSPEGEICIKNNCLMKGYFKAPEITASVFDGDGYLKTGDIGEYDHDGFLSITGRVKDQFKTDKGKYISPSSLEIAISVNADVEQICVVGTGVPQPLALITLSEIGKSKSKEDVSNSLIETINQINPKFEKHEKIEKVIIMKEEWTVDNGLVTPTLKVKRNSIEKIHQPLYKSWFDMNNKVIFEKDAD